MIKPFYVILPHSPASFHEDWNNSEYWDWKISESYILNTFFFLILSKRVLVFKKKYYIYMFIGVEVVGLGTFLAV